MGDCSHYRCCRDRLYARRYPWRGAAVIIPFWLKIAGPIAALLLTFVAVSAWGNHKYHTGYDNGVQATDSKWEAAAAKLKADAAKSATKADDAAANRLENFVEQQKSDQEAIDEANRNGSSPLDAIFG